LAALFCQAATARDLADWRRALEGVLMRAEEEAAGMKSNPETGPQRGSPAPHPVVLQFVHYYQSAGAKTWAGALRRLRPIRPVIENILSEEGVPRELIWVGLVESGYDRAARSPKNAVGMWQLIPETARRFGLVVGRVDERIDTVKATRAAARYLRLLYETFGDWQLALAAYNAGEARVQSAIGRAGTRDFRALADGQYLPRETRAYVPAVMAAQILDGAEMGKLYKRTDSITRQTIEAPFSIAP
jgi:hypothetical protein